MRYGSNILFYWLFLNLNFGEFLGLLSQSTKESIWLFKLSTQKGELGNWE